jgi:hypothetical protein
LSIIVFFSINFSFLFMFYFLNIFVAYSMVGVTKYVLSHMYLEYIIKI